MNFQDNIEKSLIECDRTALASLLQQLGANASKKNLKCPFHDDKSPSATISATPEGKYYFKCFVCDICYDVWELTAITEGKDVKDVLKDLHNSNPRSNSGGNTRRPITTVNTEKPKPSWATHSEAVEAWKAWNTEAIIENHNPYTDPETGDYDYSIMRYRPNPTALKKFMPFLRNGDGRWRLEHPVVRPLFNRQRMADAQNILIVEGEKCVRAFTALNLDGWAATSNSGGALAVHSADWTPLAGKNCFIWHDNDESGLAHFEAVKEKLLQLIPLVNVLRVRIEDLELDVKQDIADYLEIQKPDPSEVLLVLQDSEIVGASNALADRIKQITSGTYKHISFNAMRSVSNLSRALMPGTVVTLCGEPGAGKSFLMLEEFWRWRLDHDVDARIFMFEDDDAYHQQRMFAQIAGDSHLTDPDYIQANADKVREQFAKYQSKIEMASRFITTAKSQQQTLTDVAKWIEVQAESGADVIICDPITAAKASEKPWKDDQDFMFKAKEIVERTGSRLILTTHPRIGQAGKASLSGMAGGATYPRFSQTVLWLQCHDKHEQYEYSTPDGMRSAAYKQVMQIRKCRNGKGQGSNVALNLDILTLNYREWGLITEA